jgi:hypothetical protein
MKGEQAFAEEFAAGRMILRRSLQKQEFRKALALASPALSYELDQYIHAPEETLRRIRRTERSLIRYYSRAAFKLSPFSSFTRIGLLRLSEDKVPSYKLAPRVRSHVRLNRSLIASFAECVAKHAELGGYVPVFVTTAHLHKENKLILLQRVYNGATPTRLRKPRERAVNVSHTAAMEWVKAYMLASDGQVQLRKLISDFRKALPEPDQADAYIHKLIDLGFLIHKIPMRDTESTGLETLISFLNNLPSSLATAAKSQLERLGRLAAGFASAGSQQRRALLREVANASSEIFALLGVQSPNWEGLVIFEDCGEEKLGHVPVSKQWKSALEDLDSFVSLYASLLDRNLSVRMAIAQALRDDFAGGPVDLIEFLHQFTATPAPTAKGEGLYSYDHTPFSHGLGKIHDLAVLRDEMGRVLATSSNAEEIEFRRLAEQHQWLERLRALDADPHEAPVVGVSCHCQPVKRADGSTDIVINGIFDSAINVLLRSCNHLAKSEQKQVIQEIQGILQETYPQTIPCELMATFDFNVNLHPRITERVVDSLDQDIGNRESIKLSDLGLRLKPNRRIALVHRDWGTEITPLHLGMMEVSFATFSQHFLSSLSSICMIASRPFHPYNWSSGPQKNPVETFPRLVFGHCVLRRRGWSLLPAALPNRDREDTDFTFFLRVQRWRRDLGIPEEAFVLAEETPAEAESRKAWNSRKPQYIHFENFFLVDVFAKLIADTKKRLYIEEMLPHRTEWNQYNSRRTTEVIVNLCIARNDESAASNRTGAQ